MGEPLIPESFESHAHVPDPITLGVELARLYWRIPSEKRPFESMRLMFTPRLSHEIKGPTWALFLIVKSTPYDQPLPEIMSTGGGAVITMTFAGIRLIAIEITARTPTITCFTISSLYQKRPREGPHRVKEAG